MQPMNDLGTVIDCLDKPAFTEALIAWLPGVVSHDNVALLAYYQDRRPDLLFARSMTPEVHADLEVGYLSGAYLLDPFHELHVRNEPEGLYRLADVAPDQFSRNRYFIEYYRETTMVDEIAFVCRPSKGVSLQLCLGRDRKSNRRFSRKELEVAATYSPVISALFRRQWSDLQTIGSFDENEMRESLIRAAKEQYDIQLTKRHSEIILLILKGHSSMSIGLQLGVSYETIKVFRRQIYKRCGISSQAELFNLFVPLLSN